MLQQDSVLLRVGRSGFGQGTLGEEIERRCLSQPDLPAIVASGCAPMPYSALLRLIHDVRAELQTGGFGPKARVAVALPSGPHGALAIVAVACSATALPLNPNHTPDEVEASFAALQPGAVLLLKGSDSAARQVAERQRITIIDAVRVGESVIGLRITAPRAPRSIPLDETDPGAPAFILQTSGTTAEPKRIPFSHRNMLAAAARIQEWFKLTPEDRCLCVSSVHYSHGLKVSLFTSLLSGGTVAFPDDPGKFDASEWFDALAPTWYSAGPTLHRLVADHTQSDAGLRHRLRFISSGGAALPAVVRGSLERNFGVPVVEHYGSSEAALTAANTPWPGGAKPGTVGIPWPGTIAVVGEHGGELPRGKRGEVLVRGPTLISGYLDADTLNRACFVDGWFKTGDIGSIDEDGFLTLHGRRTDLINRGGEKVSPTEIDEVLLRHPAVAEAAAFAIPHSSLGQDVAAAVVLKSGLMVSPVELRRHVGGKLAAFKVPRKVFIVEALPKGSTGKVSRQRLSETLAVVPAPTRPAPAASCDDSLSLELTKIWERLLNRAPIGIDDDFFDSGGDSLLAVELLAEIEGHLCQAVPSSILFEASTIRQLTQILAKGDTLEHKPLFQLSRGSGTPLFFFHGAFNTGGSYVRRLATLLGPEQPFFVVSPHGLDSAPIPRSLEAMAADRLTLIREAQPHGPYRLAGYCLSGLVAFEVARQLAAAGEKIDFVAMIDSPTINARRSVRRLLAAMARTQHVLGPAMEPVMMRAWYDLVAADKSATLPEQLRRGWTSLARLWWRWLKGGAPGLDASVAARDKSDEYAIALSRYFPDPLAVRAIYFACDFRADPWRRISRDITTIDLTGDHSAIVADPTEIARHLRTVLDDKA